MEGAVTLSPFTLSLSNANSSSQPNDRLNYTGCGLSHCLFVMDLFNPTFLYGRFQPVCFSSTRQAPSENNLAGMFPPNLQIGSHAKPYGAPNSLTVPSLKRVLLYLFSQQHYLNSRFLINYFIFCNFLQFIKAQPRFFSVNHPMTIST